MTSEEFKILCYKTKEYKQVEQKCNDVGGGKITFEEIDEINTYKDIDKISISGLRQDTFEYFIKTQAHKFKAIMFWKNKLVEDLSLLSTLKEIKFIGFFHNQRVKRLWDMEENVSLEGLYISDFTRLHTLQGIEMAPRLERLSFGDAVWNSSTVHDLQPLENSKIKEFSFVGKGIEVEDISIYTRIPNLQVLDFRSNLYTTEQLAWLVAKLPNVKGYALRPFIAFDREKSEMKDILICGKRKPFLYSEKDADKIEKYVSEFEQLVMKYKNE